jgi:hypothetical protein
MRIKRVIRGKRVMRVNRCKSNTPNVGQIKIFGAPGFESNYRLSRRSLSGLMLQQTITLIDEIFSGLGAAIQEEE